MLIVSTTKQFNRDVRLMIRQGKNMEKLFSVMRMLEAKSNLETNKNDHPLKGNYVGQRECHIEPDWLLIYKITKTHLYLTRTGSHSELFK